MARRCMVDPNAEVLDKVNLSDSTRARIRRGELFSVDRDREILLELCRASLGGHSPLLDPAGMRTVGWVAAGTRAKAHLRRAKGPGGAGNDVTNSRGGAHVWVQLALKQLANRYRQTCLLEAPVGESQRADAVWLESKICWEVDLSPQSCLAQEERYAQRRRDGFSTISLMDSRRRNDTHRYLDRVLIRHLGRTAKSRGAAGFGLPQLFASNAYDFADGQWVHRPRFTFADIVNSILTGSLAYRTLRPGRPGHPAQSGWVSAGDAIKELAWQLREDEQRERSHRLVQVARRPDAVAPSAGVEPEVATPSIAITKPEQRPAHGYSTGSWWRDVAGFMAFVVVLAAAAYGILTVLGSPRASTPPVPRAPVPSKPAQLQPSKRADTRPLPSKPATSAVQAREHGDAEKRKPRRNGSVSSSRDVRLPP